MDRKIIKAIQSQIPECSEHVENASTASKASIQALKSAMKFHDQYDDILLSNARIYRVENLLTSLRESLHLLTITIRTLKQNLQQPVKTKKKKEKSWDSLGDSWWDERAVAILNRMQHVENVIVFLDDDDDENSYEGAIVGVGKRVDLLVKRWNDLLTYVDEWKDVALVVSQGIGEAGSLLPM